jgi:SAM-dependent methyltransferase
MIEEATWDGDRPPVHYPKTKRDVGNRGLAKTDEDRRIARRFEREFFDGDRRYGYGGYYYHPRFWQPVVPTLRDHFDLKHGTSLLDVGCGKGFMLHDLAALIPGIIVKGVDISKYAIANAIEDMKRHVQVADAVSLPFPDRSFDAVISINTVHNLAREKCGQALREIERVSRRGSFITVDAYRTEEEKARMLAWNLTALTIMHIDEWVDFFKEVGYTGDYYWFIP